jgi:hypothetical protein
MRLELRPLDPEGGTFMALDPRAGIVAVVVVARPPDRDAIGRDIDGRLHRRAD